MHRPHTNWHLDSTVLSKSRQRSTLWLTTSNYPLPPRCTRSSMSHFSYPKSGITLQFQHSSLLLRLTAPLLRFHSVSWTWKLFERETGRSPNGWLNGPSYLRRIQLGRGPISHESFSKFRSLRTCCFSRGRELIDSTYL